MFAAEVCVWKFIIISPTGVQRHLERCETLSTQLCWQTIDTSSEDFRRRLSTFKVVVISLYYFSRFFSFPSKNSISQVDIFSTSTAATVFIHFIFSSVIFSSSVFLISIYTFSIKSTHTESTTVPLQRLSPCHICCTARFDTTTTTTNLLPPSIEVVLIISSLLSDNSHCW